jgi:hypothetical protein
MAFCDVIALCLIPEPCHQTVGSAAGGRTEGRVHQGATGKSVRSTASLDMAIRRASAQDAASDREGPLGGNKQDGNSLQVSRPLISFRTSCRLEKDQIARFELHGFNTLPL